MEVVVQGSVHTLFRLPRVYIRWDEEAPPGWAILIFFPVPTLWALCMRMCVYHLKLGLSFVLLLRFFHIYPSTVEWRQRPPLLLRLVLYSLFFVSQTFLSLFFFAKSKKNLAMIIISIHTSPWMDWSFSSIPPLLCAHCQEQWIVREQNKNERKEERGRGKYLLTEFHWERARTTTTVPLVTFPPTSAVRMWVSSFIYNSRKPPPSHSSINYGNASCFHPSAELAFFGRLPQ